MKRDLVASIVAMVVFTILLGLVYPLVITGVSQVAFPGNANGQKIYVNGKLVGSKIIGQSFSRPVIGKNGKPKEEEGELGHRTGSALLPVASVGHRRRRLQRRREHVLQPRAQQRRDQGSRRRKHQGLPRTGQAYDPGLTVAQVSRSTRSTPRRRTSTPKSREANARIQAHRVAAVRHLPLATVNGLISKYTDEPRARLLRRARRQRARAQPRPRPAATGQPESGPTRLTSAPGAGNSRATGGLAVPA